MTVPDDEIRRRRKEEKARLKEERLIEKERLKEKRLEEEKDWRARKARLEVERLQSEEIRDRERREKEQKARPHGRCAETRMHPGADCLSFIHYRFRTCFATCTASRRAPRTAR